MTYAKLDHVIVSSSIWSEPPETRVVWITMLALKDENGFVRVSRSGLQRISNVCQDKFDSAILCLESPDPDSRTVEYEGRRIEKIDGGWLILNNDKYKDSYLIQKEKTKERVRKHRENKLKTQSVTGCNVTHALQHISKSVSVSKSVSDSLGKTENPLPEKAETIKRNIFTKPTVEEISAYCRERKNSVDAETFFDFYESKDWLIGKAAMKNWRAAVRTWEKSNRNQSDDKPKSAMYQLLN